MGRKLQAKRWRRMFKEAKHLEVQNAKPPCETCAFRDPEAWVSHESIGRKILSCLKTGDYFFCHDGMSLGGPDGNEYQVPRRADGTEDRSKMEPCGGFIRFAAKVRGLSTLEQQREMLRLQRHFLGRYLESGKCPELEDFTVNDLQYAVNLATYMKGGEENE